MIRKILSRYATPTTSDSTPAPSGSSSTSSTASRGPSYNDILDARREARKWAHQAERVLILLENTDAALDQLVVDRRLAVDMKQTGRLATLDSDRLEHEARRTHLQAMLLQLTGTTARSPAEALVRQVRIALNITHELENTWLQLQELVTVAIVNGALDETGDLLATDAERRAESARQDFFTSVAQLVLHLGHTNLTPTESA